MSKDTINNPRAEIDAIDEELLRLLNKRAAIALRVGAAKSSAETSLCDPRREREVLARLRQENPALLPTRILIASFNGSSTNRSISSRLHTARRGKIVRVTGNCLTGSRAPIGSRFSVNAVRSVRRQLSGSLA